MEMYVFPQLNVDYSDWDQILCPVGIKLQELKCLPSRI